jgi:hypothetical protein
MKKPFTLAKWALPPEPLVLVVDGEPVVCRTVESMLLVLATRYVPPIQSEWRLSCAKHHLRG